MTGFVVHRTANGTDTTFTVPRTAAATYRWVDSQILPGATYAVSAVSADGEGVSSTPAPVGPITNAIAVVNTVQQPDGSTRTYLGELASQGAQQVVPLATSGPTQQVRYRTASYLGTFGAYVTAASATKATSTTLNLVAGTSTSSQPAALPAEPCRSTTAAAWSAQ